jgi:hypothetical protein
MTIKQFLERNDADIPCDLAPVIRAEYDKAVSGQPYRTAPVPEHLRAEFGRYVKNELINRRVAGTKFRVPKNHLWL